MRKLILPLLVLALTSCSYLQVHKMDVQQGNIVDPALIQSLHLGMNESQVKTILGSPILTHVFRSNRVDYVYTYKPGYGNFTDKYLTLVFEKGRLYETKGNLYSPYIKN